METHFDFSDFNKKFDYVAKSLIPALTEKGLGRAMLQVLNDCIMEIPTVPIKEGWLRGSGSIFVQNEFIKTSEGKGRGKPKYANMSFNESAGVDKVVGVIGFNAPYAAKMHEGLDLHFTDPSSGPKYLENKLITNKETYAEIIANTVKEGG